MHRTGIRMLIGLVLLAGGVVALAAARDPGSGAHLVATWRLVSATYGPPGDQFNYVPKELVHLKHVTPTHFTVVTYEVSSKKVTMVGGGRYSWQDGAYKETIEFAVGGSLPKLLGKEQSFSAKLDGDRWTHTGVRQRFAQNSATGPQPRCWPPRAAGIPLGKEALAALSPSLTPPINRFGRYQLDMEQRPPELVCDFGLCNGGVSHESLPYP
jgi:hypothetical protein